MGKDWKWIKRASRDFELARGYRSDGNVAVATFLYNKAVEGALRALYSRKTGRDAPKDVSLQYLANRTKIPAEVSDYIGSVLETEKVNGEVEEMEMPYAYPKRGRFESSLLYLDGLTKRLLDCARAYQ